MRDRVTLLDGTELKVGDKCRARIGMRWRVGKVVEIAEGTGVDRVFIAVKSGVKLGPIGRYRLRSWVKTG